MAVLAVVVVLPFALGGVAHADVNDFVVERFSADYTLSQADAQGELKVRETIDVDFHDYNHGILRALPDRYKKHSLQLRIGTVAIDDQSGQWSSYSESGNTVLKIGDPAKTVTGHHRYVIDYTMRNVITFYSDHDELYWDINGDQWQQTANEVLVSLHLPGGLKLSSQKPICYTGHFGSTEQACNVSVSASAVSAQTTRALQGYETLSLVAGFQKGYFRPSPWYETAGEYAASALKFVVPLLLIAGTAGRHWFKYGRDPKGRRVIVPEYEPPDGLRPIEAGTVADFRTDNRDITATIIDLAIRGYLKIIETVNKRLLHKDAKTYSLRLENADFSKLNEFEEILLNGIFSQPEKGQEISLTDLKYKLSSTASSLQKKVKDSLIARGYIHKNVLSVTLHFAGRIALAYLISIVLAVIFPGAATTLGIGLGTALVVVFMILMPARTAQGVAAKESILGLKMYLEVAEAERIKKLQSPDAPYATKSSEPKKTVELFEKLLPFAMVLGVEQQWAKQFADIYRTPPDWYQGNWTTFNAVYLASSLNSGVQSSINSAFSSPSSSSSSGFGGGGSGGGGGGGGGGGW